MDPLQRWRDRGFVFLKSSIRIVSNIDKESNLLCLRFGRHMAGIYVKASWKREDAGVCLIPLKSSGETCEGAQAASIWETNSFYRKFHIVRWLKTIHEAFCVFAQVRRSPHRRHVLDTMAYNWCTALRSQRLVAPSARPVAGQPVPELLALRLTILSTS